MQTSVWVTGFKLQNCKGSRRPFFHCIDGMLQRTSEVDVRYTPELWQRANGRSFRTTTKTLILAVTKWTSAWTSVRLYSTNSRHKTQQISTLTWILSCVWYSSLLCQSLSLQELHNPTKLKQKSNLVGGRCLVIMSIRLSVVPIFITWISPHAITSRMKWYLTSMCFVLSWNI